jgi:hypothetical protein
LINLVSVVFVKLHSTLSLFDEPFIVSRSEAYLKMVQMDCCMAERRQSVLNTAILYTVNIYRVYINQLDAQILVISLYFPLGVQHVSDFY